VFSIIHRNYRPIPGPAASMGEAHVITA
jgi:hypothetical protein